MDEPSSLSDLAPQRKRPPELDADDRPLLRAPARVSLRIEPHRHLVDSSRQFPSSTCHCLMSARRNSPQRASAPSPTSTRAGVVGSSPAATIACATAAGSAPFAIPVAILLSACASAAA